MSATTKKIDFTRPTKFTPDHERRLQRALAAFCRTSSTRLSAELRLPIELEVTEVTQLTWANAHDRLSPSALCAVVELDPVGTQLLLSADSGFILTGIESLLSGPCDETPPERRLTEIDLALARRLFDGMLAQLTVVWRDLAGTDLRLATVDSHLETAQVASVSEPTLSLAMRARMQGTEFMLTMLVPHRAIAPVETACSSAAEARRGLPPVSSMSWSSRASGMRAWPSMAASMVRTSSRPRPASVRVSPSTAAGSWPARIVTMGMRPPACTGALRST